MTHNTREDWLLAAVTHLRGRFDGLDAQPTDKLAVLVSWPKGHAKAIGQCFLAEHWTADGTTYVSVSPLLGADPANVLDVLLHELVHACGIKGHKADFKKVAVAVGLTGKMSATVPTEECRKDMEALAAELGPYPHVVMAPREDDKPKKKGNQIKLVSPENPEYCVYMLPGKLEEFGPPLCPFSQEPMIPA